MPDPNKVHSNLNAKDFNYLLYMMIIIAIIGVLYQQWKNVQAGLIYGTLFTIGVIVSITLVHFFVKDDRTMKPISDFIKIPISTKLSLAVFFSLIGLIVPFIISPLLKLFTGFSITSFAVPLFGAGGTFQSFAIASIETSMSWKLFNLTWVASTIETFTYSYVAVVVGIMLGIIFFKLIKKHGEPLPRWGIMTIAMSFSVLAFIGSHSLNNTYSGWMYAIAGIFILISNLSIYFAGSFILFWTWYHFSNNLIYILELDGWKAVMTGFASWYGAIFVVVVVLMCYYLLNNWDKTMKDLKEWRNG